MKKPEHHDLLIEANVVTVPAIKDVMLGVSQMRKKLELDSEGLPMMIMITDDMEHMIEPLRTTRTCGANPGLRVPTSPVRLDGVGWCIHASRGDSHACA